jgi:chromosome segregation ATPase
MNDLPPELIEACHIVSAQLNGSISRADLDILADDVDFFLTNIPRISPILSTHLSETGRIITQLAFAGSDDDILKLSAQATALQESISNQSTSISVTRSRITDLATTLHATYRMLLEVSIRLLEQTLHGSISRGVRAQAEHLATVAKGLELKLQVMASTDAMLTDPALQTELESYRTRLETRANELSSQVASNEKALAEYGRAGKGMLEIAKRYAEVKKECDSARDEIAKLEARQSDVD